MSNRRKKEIENPAQTHKKSPIQNSNPQTAKPSAVSSPWSPPPPPSARRPRRQTSHPPACPSRRPRLIPAAAAPSRAASGSRRPRGGTRGSPSRAASWGRRRRRLLLRLRQASRLMRQWRGNSSARSIACYSSPPSPSHPPAPMPPAGSSSYNDPLILGFASTDLLDRVYVWIECFLPLPMNNIFFWYAG